LRQAVNAGKLDVRSQFLKTHCRRLDGAGKVFPDAPQIFPGERADFLPAIFPGQSTSPGFSTPARRCRASSQKANL